MCIFRFHRRPGMNADDVSQLRARHERAIKGFLQRHEATVARCRSLLTWESPAHSATAVTAAVAAVWIVASSAIPIVCLTALASACVVVSLQCVRSNDERKFAVHGPSARSRPLSVPHPSEVNVRLTALASRLADGSCCIWLLWSKACDLRRRNPQAFCALSCSTCLAVIILGRFVSVATVVTFLILVAFMQPLLMIRRLLIRVPSCLDNILNMFDHSPKPEYLIINRDDAAQFIVSAPERRVPAVFTDSDNSSSMFGSFLPNVAEMPSHDDAPAAMSIGSRPLDLLRDELDSGGNIDGSVSCRARAGVPQLDETTTISDAGLDPAYDRSLDSGPLREWGAFDRYTDDVLVSGEAPLTAESTQEPLPSTTASYATNVMHRVPLALRAVATSVWDGVSGIPTPVALWRLVRTRQAGEGTVGCDHTAAHSSASLATAESGGDDALDYVFVTADDAQPPLCVL